MREIRTMSVCPVCRHWRNVPQRLLREESGCVNCHRIVTLLPLGSVARGFWRLWQALVYLFLLGAILWGLAVIAEKLSGQ